MIVNAIWIDGPFPPLQAMCARSWLHYGHEYVLWLYESFLDDVPDGVRLENANEILTTPPILRYQDPNHFDSPILHANIFRYEFLATVGGAFIDADTLCLADFDYMNDTAFSSEQCGDELYPNFAFVNVPHESWNRYFAKSIRNEAFDRLDIPKRGRFGPSLLRQYVESCGLQEYVLPTEAFCPIPWNEATRIFQADPPDISGSAGIHLWQSILDRKRCDLKKQYPATSLWEGWKREYS